MPAPGKGNAIKSSNIIYHEVEAVEDVLDDIIGTGDDESVGDADLLLPIDDLTTYAGLSDDQLFGINVHETLAPAAKSRKRKRDAEELQRKSRAVSPPQPPSPPPRPPIGISWAVDDHLRSGTCRI